MSIVGTWRLIVSTPTGKVASTLILNDDGTGSPRAVSQVSTPITTACAVIFLWLRVAHAVGMITGWARLPLRPIIYFSGWIVLLVYAWQVLSHAA